MGNAKDAYVLCFYVIYDGVLYTTRCYVQTFGVHPNKCLKRIWEGYDKERIYYVRIVLCVYIGMFHPRVGNTVLRSGVVQ